MTVTIRAARAADADAMFVLLHDLATSFTPDRAAFDASFAALLSADDAWLAVADDAGEVVGYCLGFVHRTFYANGCVGMVEEVIVRADRRGQGIGRALIDAFEQWAKSRDAALVGLMTRRAAPFYLALGYENSATYFRKLL